MNSEWIMCPICGNKTRDKIREDTELKNFPLLGNEVVEQYRIEDYR